MKEEGFLLWLLLFAWGLFLNILLFLLFLFLSLFSCLLRRFTMHILNTLLNSYLVKWQYFYEQQQQKARWGPVMMAQWLRANITTSKDWSSVSTTHIRWLRNDCNSCSIDSDILSWLMWEPEAQTQPHKIIKQSLWKKLEKGVLNTF